jgi:hypothetical protein
VIALIRYTWSDVIRSQRWVAPVLCFFVLGAIIDADTGSLLPTYAVSATVLLFVTTWLTIVITNTEDFLQHDITIVTAGSQAKVRVAKLLAAYIGAVGLAAVVLIGPPLASSQNVPLSEVAAGAAAHLVTALAGVALGALCSRPIIRRTAWALLAAVAVNLADIVVPHGVPTRQLLVLFNETQPRDLALAILLIGAETLVIAVIAVTASISLARPRN